MKTQHHTQLILVSTIIFALLATSIANLTNTSFQSVSFAQSVSGWSVPVRIAVGSEPSIAVDSNGDAHIAWLANAGALYSNSTYYSNNRSGSWSSPVNISISPDADQSNSPSIASSSDGIVHVVWSQGPQSQTGLVWYQSILPDNTWTSPITISNNLRRPGEASAFVDKDDNLHVAFVSGYNSSGASVYYRNRSSDGTWSALEKASTSFNWYYNAVIVGGNRFSQGVVKS